MAAAYEQQQQRQHADENDSRIIDHTGGGGPVAGEVHVPLREPLPPQQQQFVVTIPPMETVLYNLHCKCCNFCLRKTNRWWRCRLEETVLILAVCSFVALALAHGTFLHHNAEAVGSISKTCLSSIPGVSLLQDDDDTSAAGVGVVMHLILLEGNNDDSSSTSNSFASLTPLRKSTMSRPAGCEFEQQQQLPLLLLDEEEEEETDACAPLVDNVVDDDVRTTTSAQRKNNNQNDDIYFTYSKHHPGRWPLLRHHHNVWEQQLVKDKVSSTASSSSSSSPSVQYIYISKSDAKCFGEPFLQSLVFYILTPDTVMINWLIGAFGQQGYVYNPRSGKELSLNPLQRISSPGGHNNDDDDQRTTTKHHHHHWSYHHAFFGWICHKVSIVAKTTFLFFITTTLVSFTLRETQGRMLHFTHHLLQHVRSNRPVVNLVVKHVAENVVFVPITVGIIFFLMEFYRDDKLLAFMVLTLLWICESFSVVSLRTVYGIEYFPRTFFLLFAAFHFYYFSFPFGFSYAALTTSILFMVHSMLFFWHRYELPAVCRGQVAAAVHRSSPQQPRPGRRPGNITNAATTTASTHGRTMRHSNSSDEDDDLSSSSFHERRLTFGLNGEVMFRPSESFLNIQESALQAIVGRAANDLRQPALLLEDI